MGLRELTPWYLKIAAKVALSRLPVSYRTWQAVRLFSHGGMERAEYAYQVFRKHYEASEFARKQDGFVALEIGPGDGLLSAVIAASFGASKCYLVDTGYYAGSDLAPYREIAELLARLNLRPPDLTGRKTYQRSWSGVMLSISPTVWPPSRRCLRSQSILPGRTRSSSTCVATSSTPQSVSCAA